MMDISTGMFDTFKTSIKYDYKRNMLLTQASM